jgi:hypothetical protein
MIAVFWKSLQSAVEFEVADIDSLGFNLACSAEISYTCKVIHSIK